MKRDIALLAVLLFGAFAGATPPYVNWVSQVPADVDTFNLFSTSGLNITYNITDQHDVNETSPTIYYKTNTTTSDYSGYVNGTGTSGFSSKLYTSNVTENWLFRLFDNQVYPARYNVDEITMETTGHGNFSFNATGQNGWLLTRLYNVSNSAQYGIFETYSYKIANNALPQQWWYCNSSFNATADYRALDVEGTSDHVTAPDTDSLDIGNNGSIETWLYLNTASVGTGIVHKGNLNSNADAAYSFEVRAGRRLMMRLEKNNTNGYFVQLNGNIAITLDTWAHVAATWNSTTVTLYVNGAQDTSATYSFIPQNSSGALFIGSRIATTDFLNGRLDELLIYNRTLSAAEITAHRNAGFGRYAESTENGLVAGYHFDETSGTVAYDFSPYGNNGTKVNNPAVAPGKVIMNPDASPNCAEFFAIPYVGVYPATTFNHTHTVNSSHLIASFAVNTTTGTVSGVGVTPTSYFATRGGYDWNTTYIPTDTSSARYSANNGGNWSPIIGTLDAHLHQYDGTDTLYYYVCAKDVPGNENCTTATMRSDLLERGSMPPSAPHVTNPTATTYAGNVEINYTAALSPNGYAIDLYNVSLTYENGTFLRTIISNNSPALSCVWNSTSVADGNYTVTVRACDINALCANGTSNVFTVDNSVPVITVVSPANNSHFNFANITVNFSATDPTTPVEMWFFNGTENVTYDNETEAELTDGEHTFGFYASDGAGNLAYAETAFNVTLPVFRGGGTQEASPSASPTASATPYAPSAAPSAAIPTPPPQATGSASPSAKAAAASTPAEKPTAEASPTLEGAAVTEQGRWQWWLAVLPIAAVGIAYYLFFAKKIGGAR
ncbi:Concanavalin A-like lectin/glucanases superfamily protein [Candidatus Norongarragalina meridionalis]|nr:Concanavalin A-like lectin/glucanases superfamily protein [Candidatus Norongarragalina meridionalis]